MDKKYQLSPYLRIVSGPNLGLAMVYHTLYGNPRILNGEGLQLLLLFVQPLSVGEASESCEGDPREVIEDFASIFFLVEEGLDERAFLFRRRAEHLLQVGKGKTVDRMGLAISDACNFGCRHCLHLQPSGDKGEALAIYRRDLKGMKMSWETAKKCLDQYIGLLRKQGREIGKVHFGNAEPLLNWPVIDKVLTYCEGFEDIRFEFAINTNLALLTKERAELLKKYQVRIAASLDGTQRANDAIRITKSGRGTFKRIVGKFDLLAEIGYPLDGFSITVTKDNFSLVGPDIVDFAHERGMKSLAFDYDLVSLTGIPVEERVEKIMALKKYANARGIDFFGTWDSAFRNLSNESLLTGNHAFCAAVEGKSLEFNVDGGIKVCSHATGQIGHVNNFAQAFASGGGLVQVAKERFPGTEGYCHGCPIEGACGGQCEVTREVVSRTAPGERNGLFSEMCDFYRLITDALMAERIGLSC